MERRAVDSFLLCGNHRICMRRKYPSLYRTSEQSLLKSRRERKAAVAEDVCKDQSEKNHKSDLWYRQLPSQTAQETCKLLDKAWKSFYALKKSEGVREPNPPRFKNKICGSPICRWGSCTKLAQTGYGCHCQRN